MAYRPVTMQKLTITKESIAKLTEQERYTYYLLGYIFNELNALQKFIAFAMPVHQDMRPPRREPELGQALMLSRIACSKIFEANEAIRGQEVAKTLRAVVLSKMDNGAARFKDIKRMVESSRWLHALRNELGFHFGKFTQWRPFITPDENWTDDVVYRGERLGQTFFQGSDSVAVHMMFKDFLHLPPSDAVDSMLSEMVNLLDAYNTFVEEALGILIQTLLVSHGGWSDVGKVLAPEFDSVRLPFWAAMPKEKIGKP